MDWFDDIQVEELQNFDFIEEDELCDTSEDKTFQAYLNSNYDY